MEKEEITVEQFHRWNSGLVQRRFNPQAVFWREYCLRSRNAVFMTIGLSGSNLCSTRFFIPNSFEAFGGGLHNPLSISLLDSDMAFRFLLIVL